MKLEDRDKPLFYVGLAIVVLLTAVVFWRQPLFGDPWVKPECGNDTLECLAYTWQTLITGLIALVIGGWTVVSIRKQVKQAEDHRIEDEIADLVRLKVFLESLRDINSGLIVNLRTALAEFEDPDQQFNHHVHNAQLTPVPLPDYVENHVSYETRIDIDALANYRRNYAALLARNVGVFGVDLEYENFDAKDVELALRILNGCIRNTQQLIKDVDELDLKRIKKRLKELRRRHSTPS